MSPTVQTCFFADFLSGQGAGGVDEADDEEMVTHARVKRVVKSRCFLTVFGIFCVPEFRSVLLLIELGTH